MLYTNNLFMNHIYIYKYIYIYIYIYIYYIYIYIYIYIYTPRTASFLWSSSEDTQVFLLIFIFPDRDDAREKKNYFNLSTFDDFADHLRG